MENKAVSAQPSALDTFLEQHEHLCGLNDAYSQSGCTCGRDGAIDELSDLRVRLARAEAVPAKLMELAQAVRDNNHGSVSLASVTMELEDLAAALKGGQG